MKPVVFLLCAILCAPALAADQIHLAEVRSVYLLPMAYGMDQFLASRLTAAGVFQVVADPKKADAVFTDQLGKAFEARLDELFPPTEVAKPEEETDVAEDKEKVGEERSVRFSTFGRGRGTFFLVDAKSRAVVWSTYHKPKTTSSEELHRAAERIINRLKEDLKNQ